ncbi:MAG: class I SAM-dependent methyltransferase [Gammaproteobacteria bacterium]|nr:class I SAM-dependent methyltransferase [Gammaproteobacteria bacterium]
MNGAKVSLLLEDRQRLDEARRLTQRLGLSLDGSRAELLLVLTATRLELRDSTARDAGSVCVDFVAGKSAHRRRYGGGRGQPLAKAVGLKQGRNPLLLDATAGLGRDAFVLASLGCPVVLIERSPVVAALLEDGLRRALQDPEVAPIAARMQLINNDAGRYLAQLADSVPADVIYLDPMYPARNKRALVKKEMRMLQRLLGDNDNSGLLQSARQHARYRVVVKRPRGADWLDGERPSMSIESPNTRFDVYVKRAFDA